MLVLAGQPAGYITIIQDGRDKIRPSKRHRPRPLNGCRVPTTSTVPAVIRTPRRLVHRVDRTEGKAAEDEASAVWFPVSDLTIPTFRRMAERCAVEAKANSSKCHCYVKSGFHYLSCLVAALTHPRGKKLAGFPSTVRKASPLSLGLREALLRRRTSRVLRRAAPDPTKCGAPRANECDFQDLVLAGPASGTCERLFETLPRSA
jgi:hypothetical protein